MKKSDYYTRAINELTEQWINDHYEERIKQLLTMKKETKLQKLYRVLCFMKWFNKTLDKLHKRKKK